MAKSQADDDRPSGTLRCECDELRYTCAGEDVWRIPVPSIAVVGEYTLPLSQVRDDYFLVLVAEDGRWYEGSYDARGFDEAVTDLGTRLADRLEPGLANSTLFRSRVIWPRTLAEAPLVVPQPFTTGSLLDRIRCLIHMPRRRLVLSSAVRDFIG